MSLVDMRLPDVVTIEELSEVNNDSGSVTQTWTAQTPTRRARVTALRGRKLFEAQSEAGVVDTEVILRRFEDLQPIKHRFKFGTRILGIIHVGSVELRDRFMTVLCKEDVT